MFSGALENKDFRIDSQFYTQEPYKNSELVYDKIGNLILNAQYGISISMNEDGVGYPIYRMNEIHNMLCDIDVSKTAEITKSELKTFRLNERDVVFNRTNSFEWVGRTGLYRKLDDRDFVFASYLVRFIPDEKYLLPEYLTAFLNSKFGVNDIKRRARQSINQTNVNPEEVKAIEIPKLSLRFQNELKNCFDIGYKNNVESKSLYSKAENFLLQEIGLSDFEPSKRAVNVKSFSESFGTTGRLDAEFYQKKYESIENVILNYKNGYTYINREFEHITKKSDKDKNGYNYIEIGDVNVSDGICSSNFVLTSDLPANAKTLVEQGDLLISNVRPYRGAVTLVHFELENLIVSGAFTVLREKKESLFSNEVLKVLLRTSEYKEWLLKFNVGTSYPVIKDNDVLELPIPNIPKLVQDEIQEYIKLSEKLKKQSEHLLEVAKKAVEIAIEENEVVALNYIKQEANE